MRRNPLFGYPLISLLVAGLLLCATAPVRAHGPEGHGSPGASPVGHRADSQPTRAKHGNGLANNRYRRSIASYRIPPVALVDMHGDQVSLAAELDSGRPVLLNFIYTTCTTICPVLSATFAEVQDILAAESGEVRMISISVDPDYDTAARLRDYAEAHGAGPSWQFLTGSLSNVLAVERAFGAYRGDKANHTPLTFMHAGGDSSWVRLEGFANAADIVREYRRMLSH